MATVTGLTAERMLEIEAACIVDGAVDLSGHLILTKQDGTDIDAGDVTGPQGDPLTALAAWPVGSIFIAAVSTNPATLLGGGTWARFGQGRVLISQDGGDTDFNAAEETGGAKEFTLSVGQLPPHDHGNGTYATQTAGTHTHVITRKDVAGNSSGVARGDTTAETDTTTGSDGAHAHNVTGTSGSTGGGNTISKLMPYIVVYMWKRTA